MHLGYFNPSVNTIKITNNGKQISGKLFESGSNKWGPVNFGDCELKSFIINVISQ